MITKVYQDPMKGTSRPCPVLSSQPPSCIAKPSSPGSLSALGPSSDKPLLTPSTSNNQSDVRPKTSSGPSPSKFTLGTASGLGLTKYTVNSATVRPQTSSGPKKPINLSISTSAANKLEKPKASSGPTSTSKKPDLVISTASVNPTRHKYTLSRSTTTSSSIDDPIERLKSIAATSSTFTPSITTSYYLYPYYPPTSTLAGFHTLHSRSSSASSIRSTATVSSTSSVSSSASSTTTSSVSSTSSVLKPNSLTKEYLFYLKSDHIADQWAGMRMLSPDEEWEEWGRGLKGVLEPRMDCRWTPIGEILGH